MAEKLSPWEMLKAGLCPNCGEKGPHFVPPSLGDRGFYICESKDGEPVDLTKPRAVGGDT